IHICKIELVLTRSEKEELVKQLYEEGKTIREIAKAVHMSFGPIGNIIRKVTGDSSKDSNNIPTTSKETEALKLFQEGKTPIKIAIILNISSDETEDLYLGYLKLVHLHHLVLIYKELKYQLPSFVKLYKILRSAGVTVEEAINLLNDAKQIPFLRSTFLDLTNANTDLQKQNNNLLSELSSVQNELDSKRGYLQWYMEELKRIIFEIEQKKRELQYLD
ncbi:MAG: hypothetical protein ACRD8Z_11215, partial [Nitrososphaeraceae archaeon]